MKGSGIQMKKNLEEMQVKVANKRAILESHDGEEFSPITVAKNVLCEDGTTMQDYFDNHSESNISTKIVNSNSMSKVGQGDSVDFSDNVMNGAYEDVVLKGKSLVNVIQGSSKDKVVLPYSFEEGETVTINDTHSNGRVEVEVKGRTLVNLVGTVQANDGTVLSSDSTKRIIKATASGSSWNQINVKLIHLKPNTNYIAMFDKVVGEFENGYATAYDSVGGLDGVSPLPHTSENNYSTSNFFVVRTREGNTADNVSFRFHLNGTSTNADRELSIEIHGIKIMEYQEGMENWDIPYFEGMASVQAPTVKTCGKNLFYGEVINNKDIHGSTGLVVGGNRTIPVNFIPVKPKTTYTLTRPISSGNVGIRYYSKNQNYLSTTSFVPANGITTFTFTTPIGCYFLKFIDESNTLDNNYQIEEGSTATTYERYQSSSLTLPEEIVLRGLPNGTCDTYNTKTKECVQRIGEVVLDGSDDEQWGYNKDGSIQGKKCFNLPWELTPNRKQYGYTICDHMPITTTLDKVGVYNGQGLNILIDSNSNDVGVLKEILASKPITVQYELKTPIITKIDLPSLKTYNTITHLSSTVGEGSLVPTLASDHTVDYPVVIKPNTKYSIIANHRRRGDEENPISFNLGGANSTVVPGERVTTITTPSTLTHSELRVSGRETQISDVMVIEGEVNRQVPYFEGIGDCKSPILKSVGKNLFDINGEFTKCSYSMGIPFKPSYDATSKLDVISPNEFVITTPNNSYNDGFGQYIDVSGVDEVTVGVTALFNHSKTNLECRVMFLRVGEAIPTTIKDRDELLYPVTTINVSNGDRAELTLRTRQYARVFIMLSGAWKSEMSGTCSFTIKDVYVGANEEYEPYKSNTTTFTSNDDEIIVLRSLPNGVCDTLNVKTGEYVQIIGEITLDGTKRDDLVYHTVLKDNDGDFIRMIINGCSFYDNNKYGNCDKLPFYHEEKTKDSVEAVFPFAGEKHFYIKIKTSRINGAETMENNSSQLRDAFLNWLAQNPITVQYELATPIVKQVNVEGYPYAYENGHILLESGSQEQSLTPTIEYSIVANRGGQIRSNQRMVERHQKKLDSLYAMTLVNMIDSQYKQVLMKLKSDLGSEVTSWDI